MRPKDAAESAVSARDAALRAMSVGMGMAVGVTGARAPRDAAREGRGAAVRAEHLAALADELAERLALARATVRLYDALLGRLGPAPRLPCGASRARVAQLREEEEAHVELAREAIASLGGDPALVTLGAELEVLLSHGLHEPLGPGRVELVAHLRALVMAELAGADGWVVLTTLARLLEREDLATRFERAYLRDRSHARTVRRWAARARREARAAAPRPREAERHDGA
ncbi:MAG: hypothetical protein M5U28_24185 [Sandaracinaceae bacterium]|nr:hypothetical protein [Sandaracinaceae bacterium]